MKRRTGKELREYRETELRISQKELAAICGLTAANMNRIEQAADKPIHGYVEMIARLLGSSDDCLKLARQAIRETSAA